MILLLNFKLLESQKHFLITKSPRYYVFFVGILGISFSKPWGKVRFSPVFFPSLLFSWRSGVCFELQQTFWSWSNNSFIEFFGLWTKAQKLPPTGHMAPVQFLGAKRTLFHSIFSHLNSSNGLSLRLGPGSARAQHLEGLLKLGFCRLDPSIGSTEWR